MLAAAEVPAAKLWIHVTFAITTDANTLGLTLFRPLLEFGSSLEQVLGAEPVAFDGGLAAGVADFNTLTKLVGEKFGHSLM